MPDDEALLEQGRVALAAGEWPTAKDRFQEVLEHREVPDARFGLGVALWWLGDTEGALRCWERSFAASRKAGDLVGSVIAAFYLCLAYQMSFGNQAAARGWLARADTLAGRSGIELLNGLVLVCRAYLATDGGRPVEAERCAGEALVIARRVADADLELCATSELGAALVEMGRVEEGLSLLDEAMAGALAGEGESLDTVVLVGCRIVRSCHHAAEVRRAAQWVRAADAFHRRYGSFHLFTTCRIHHGGLLIASGAWEEAEVELRAALELGSKAEPALRARAAATLAELRLAQGRLEEAARLLEGIEDGLEAASALARMHLARGDHGAASALLRRYLRQVDEGCLDAAALTELLVEVEVARGDGSRAATRGRRLLERATGDLVVARGERCVGRALLVGEDPGDAVPHLERALAIFARLEMPLEADRTRLLLARALADPEPKAAATEARTALTGFERLGAAADVAEASAFLRSLGVKRGAAGPRGAEALTRREREVLALLGEGLSNPEIARRLFITRKTVEHHVASVLAKLGLSGRSAAAAYAARHLEGDPASR